MLLRPLLLLILAVELMGFIVLAVALTRGELPATPYFGLWAAGCALALALAVLIGLGSRITVRACLHGALLLGSAVFILPFAWLVSTSFKEPEEVFTYPPRWIPAMPEAVQRSPYLAPPADAAAPASALSPAAWAALRAHLPENQIKGFDDLQVREAVLPGLRRRVVAALPADTPPHAPVDEMAARLPAGSLAAMVRAAWAQAYRALHLGPIQFQDDQLRGFAEPVSDNTDRWWSRESHASCELLSPDTTRATMAAPFTRLRYDLSEEPFFRVQRRLTLPMPADQLLSLTVPIHQDSSWHRLKVSLELGGARYVSRDTLNLGLAGTAEWTFKLHERDGRDQRDLGIWPLYRVEEADPVDATAEPDHATLTLTVERVSRPAAVFYKYTRSYRDAWHAEPLWGRFLFNSLYLVVLNVIGQVLACSLAAFAFSRIRWPGRELVFGLVLATMMLPATVMLIPQFLIFKQLGWYNTLLPLWVPAVTGTPFFIFLLRQFMLGLPRELDESARLDGAGWLTIYWHLTLPLVRPALAAVGIFTFMNVWNEFMGPLIFLSDERLFPLSLGLYNFRTEHGGQFDTLMAASTLMVLPVVAVFFLAQRYFIEGVTLTGIKG